MILFMAIGGQPGPSSNNVNNTESPAPYSPPKKRYYPSSSCSTVPGQVNFSLDKIGYGIAELLLSGLVNSARQFRHLP